MLKVGLTGNIGSGKSTVAGLLAELGAAVIDADLLARQATEDPEVLAGIAREISPDVVRDGVLDRAALAAIVFGDKAALERLNGLVHPWVRREAARLQERHFADGARVVVQDIPLLFESGLQDGFDRVIVVDAPVPVRAARVAQRGGIDEAGFMRRDANQWPLERKRALADLVIDNSGDEEQLREQVQRIWGELVSKLPPGSSQAG